jgi:hypothetical protein
MVRKLSGLIRHRKEQSKFQMILYYKMRTIMRNGYEFPEKIKTSHFFFNLGRYLCCFYRTFTFFIGKTNKTDSFQELCLPLSELNVIKNRSAFRCILGAFNRPTSHFQQQIFCLPFRCTNDQGQ